MKIHTNHFLQLVKPSSAVKNYVNCWLGADSISISNSISSEDPTIRAKTLLQCRIQVDDLRVASQERKKLLLVLFLLHAFITLHILLSLRGCLWRIFEKIPKLSKICPPLYLGSHLTLLPIGGFSRDYSIWK